MMDSTKSNAMTNGKDDTQVYDNIIVGGGPGGLSLALEFSLRKIPYILLERQQSFAGQFRRFPICGELISVNKKNLPANSPGFLYARRYDWHSLGAITEEDAKKDPKLLFTNWSDALFPEAKEYVKYLDYIGHHPNWQVADHTQFNCGVSCVTNDDSNLFIIKTEDGRTFKGVRVFMAAGLTRAVVPDIRGVLEYGTFYQDFDKKNLEPYRGKRIMLLGGGNSAFEIAQSLVDVAGDITILARSGIKFARQTHNLRDVRSQSSTAYDLSQFGSLVTICSNRVTDIERTKDGRLLVTSHTPEPHWDKKVWRTTKMVVDYFMVCCGFEYNLSNVFTTDRVRPELDALKKYCKLTKLWESVNVPNLYFIGAAMRANDTDASSGFIHGFRYNIQALTSIICERFYNQPLTPIFECVVDPKCDNSFKPLTKYVTNLVSLSASLFELFKYSCATVTFEPISESNDNKGTTYKAQVWEVFPIEYARERWGKDKKFVGHVEVAFEFGFLQYDPKIPTHHFTHTADHFHAERSAFIHPVLHAFRHDSEDASTFPNTPGKVEEWHFKETLLARWDETYADGAGFNAEVYNNVVYNASAAALGMEQRKNTLPVHPEFISHAYALMTPEEIEDSLKEEPALRALLEANDGLRSKNMKCNMMKSH